MTSSIDSLGAYLAELGSFPVAQAVQSQAAHTAAIDAQRAAAAYLRIPFDEFYKPPRVIDRPREFSKLEQREAAAKAKAFPWRER